MAYGVTLVPTDTLNKSKIDFFSKEVAVTLSLYIYIYIYIYRERENTH